MASTLTEYDSDYEYDYNDTSQKTQKEEKDLYLNRIQMVYIVVYAICCALCLTLNFYAVIMSCRIYHKFQNHSTSVWVLALAFTHLVFSAFLVLQFLYGAALCKVSSYIFYSSMFSTATLLSLWSVSDSMGSSRCSERFRNMCCGKGTSTTTVLVLISWTFGVDSSSPSLLSRELRYTELGKQSVVE